MKVLVLILLLNPLLLFGQLEDYNWVLGKCNQTTIDTANFGNNFLTFSQDTFDLSSACIDYTTDFANAAISTKAGELLYFTNGSEIRGSDLEILENGENFQPDYPLAYPVNQSTLLLPDPSNDLGHFFMQGDVLVYADANGMVQVAMNNLQYAYLQRADSNDVGKVENRDVLINEDTLHFGLLSANRHGNGRDWWIVTNKNESNTYIKFLLDAENGMYEYDAQNIGETILPGVGQTVFSPNGNWYAKYNLSGLSGSSVGSLNLYQFDRCTGALENPLRKIYPELGLRGGVAFSPNSKLLYVTRWDKILQYDLEANDILASEIIVAEYDGFIDQFQNVSIATRFYLMQLTPNDEIFITVPNISARYLHVIEAPNIRGEGCAVRQHHLRLPKFHDFALPNLPYYRSGPVLGSTCDSLRPQSLFTYTAQDLMLDFEDQSTNSPTSWFWDFDDGATSEEQFPTHIFQSYGNFEVCLTASNEYGESTYCENVPVINTQTISTTALSNIKIVPNPTRDEFSLINAKHFNIHKIELFDLAGKRMTFLKNASSISLGTIANGMYLLKITDKEGGTFVLRLLKQ